MTKPVPVTEVATQLAALQVRKQKVNLELATLNRRRDLLQDEAEELAKEHLTLLRTFASVARLP